MDTFPIEGDELPIKVPGVLDMNTVNPKNKWKVKPIYYAGWFLLLDEFNSAPMSVQAAAYKLVLDKQVGQHKLHSKVACMAAGNLMTDKAIVNRLGTAMQSRLIHLEVYINVQEWIDWGFANRIDHRILGFIGLREELLHNFNPDHDDKTFPCPRTWHFLSDIIKPMAAITSDKVPLLAGTVGCGAANEFKGFCDVFGEVPNISEILRDPMGVNIRNDATVHYALSALVANHMYADKPDDLDALVTFVSRLPIEFQVITFQGAMRRDNALKDAPRIDRWIDDNHQDLL